MPEITLTPGQTDILCNFKAQVLAAIAGCGGGKTSLGYWWLHSRMEAYPGFTWAMAEPTFSLLSRVILNTSDMQRPTIEQYFASVGHHPQYHAVDRILQTDFGQIFLGSADNPDSMQGAAVKGYWLDEAGLMRLGAYQTALQRTSMQEGQVLLTTTPYNLGWLKREVADKANGDICVRRWKSIDRPGFPRESYERMRQRLPYWRFAMLYEAQFERPAGLIYDCFNEACIKPRKNIPDSWSWYVGHDFGGVNPAAMLYAIDPATSEIWGVAEYLPGPKSVADQVIDLKTLTKGRTVVKCIGGSHQETGWRDDYTAHGWPVFEPQPQFREVEVGINRVYALHRQNKLFVFNDLHAYLDEKMSYSRKLDDNGEPTDEIEDKERYHLLDAERYILSDFRPETQIGQEIYTIRATGKLS